MKYLSKSLSGTKKLAGRLARRLRGGEVIGLIGELGSGKTTFTQYLAKALGVKQRVNSPTFNIVKIYKIKNLKIKNFIHIDAYRLRSAQELKALGVQEYFQDKTAVTVIEWADKVKPILPKNTILIKFQLNKASRLITILRR